MSEHIEVVTDPDTGGVEMVPVPDCPEESHTDAPQIIRTVEELEARDPYTMVLTDSRYTAWYAAQIEEWELPAVVIRDGAEVRAARAALAEVRAARKALEEA